MRGVQRELSRTVVCIMTKWLPHAVREGDLYTLSSANRTPIESMDCLLLTAYGSKPLNGRTGIARILEYSYAIK